MEDLGLDIEGVNEAPKKRKTKENNKVLTKNSSQLADLNDHEIAKVFTEFKRDNRIAVIPIGFPQAGKSLMISSLMHYARKCEDVLFKTTLENDSIFYSGRIVVDNMVELFGKDDTLIGSTEAGTLDLIGININMLIRELKDTQVFSIFVANVQVQQKFYSQWIPVQVSARNIQEAKQQILAQYGVDAKIAGLRKAK